MKKLLLVISILFVTLFVKGQTHCFEMITDESWSIAENPGTGWEQPGGGTGWQIPAAGIGADGAPYFYPVVGVFPATTAKGIWFPYYSDGPGYFKKNFSIANNIDDVAFNSNSRNGVEEVYVNGVRVLDWGRLGRYLVYGTNTIAVKTSPYLAHNGFFQADFYDIPGGGSITASATYIPNCGNPSTNISLSASTGLGNWVWYKNSCGGVPIGFGTNIIVAPDTTTTYYLRTEGGCYGNSSCANIAIYGKRLTYAPITSTLPASGPVCAGTTVDFGISLPNINDWTGINFQWKVNGTDVGSNIPFLQLSNLNNNDVIKCVVSNECNTIESNSITALVYTPASTVPSSISTNAVNNTICNGASITLTANGASPANGAVYRWYETSCENGMPVGTGQSITIAPTQAPHSYFVNLEESVCKTSCANLDVVVNPQITNAVISSSASGTVCGGTNVAFTAAVTNGGYGVSYQWKLNNINVGSNSSLYNNATLLDNDVISCVVSNGCNTFTSNNLTMSINVVPSSVTISMFNNQSTTICQGGYATFTAVATNSGAHPTYKWKKNGVVVQTYSGLFTDNTSLYSTYGLNNNDVITCEMISQVACTLPVQSNGITMTVNPTPSNASIAVTTGTNPDCNGEPLTFTASVVNGGSNISYEWHLITYYPYSNNIVGTNSPTYTLQIPNYNDVVSCEIVCNGVCGYPYYLSSNSITVKVPTTFSGYIYCSDNGSTTNASVCANQTLNFGAHSINFAPTSLGNVGFVNTSPTYQWKLNGNNVGTNSSTYSKTGFADGDIITCDVVSTEPCSTPPGVTLSFTVNVYDVSSATLSIDGPAEVCSSTLPTYTAYAINAGTHPSYQWKKNGQDVGTNESYYTPDAIAVNDVITCALTTDPACGAVLTVPASNSITATTIIPFVVPTISIAATYPLTSLSNTFTATYTNEGSNPFTNYFYWYKNGNTVSEGYSTTTYTDNTLAPGDVIYCQFNSGATCAIPSSVNSNSLTVTVPPSYCTPTSGAGYLPCDYAWITNVQMGTSLNKTSACDGLYADFSTTDTLKAGAGETISYSITGNGTNNWAQRRAIYIDFNNNKDFTDVGEMVVDAGDGALNTSTGTFVLPQPLATGHYRMRVVSAFDNNFSPCNVDGGEAEDYTLVITYCTPQSSNQQTSCQYYYTSNVTLGSSVNNNTMCDGFYSDFSNTQSVTATAGETFSFSVSLSSIDAQNWSAPLNIFIDYNNDGDFEDAGEHVITDMYSDVNTPATGSITVPAFIAPGNYRIRIVDGGYFGSPSPCKLDYGEAEDYTLLIPEPVYCTPVISQPCDQWISQVMIGNINNNIAQPTVCTDGGYTDYTTSLSTTAAPGATVNFSIVGGSSLPFQQWQYADIFVDFNNDGDFDDDGERVVQDFSFYAGTAYTGSFNIPAGQPYGYYRMRVKSYNYDSNVDTYSGPCGNNTNGAVHDYRLIVNCVPNGSDVTVQGNSVGIADGDNTPGLADFTNFGNVQVNTSFSRTYTIKNTGTGPLQLTGNPTFSGGFQFNFSISNFPSSYLLQPNESTSFTVQVNMPSWAVGYTISTTLHIPTDNCDKKDYDFAISATGTCPAGGPDANLQGNGIDIPAGTGVASTTTGTDFGTVNTGSIVSHTFTVQNTGVADLNISGVIFHPIYNGNGHFSFTSQPASIVAPGGSTTFTIAFSPVDASTDFAYVYIQSDDCDESSYAFRIEGSGVVAPCTPHSWTSDANNGNWNDAANWCDGAIPSASTDAIIPTGATPYPVLSANGAVRNIEIQTGASVSISSYTLSINGLVSGTGVLKNSTASNLVINGSGNAGTLYFDQTTPGSTNTINNFTLNRSAAGKITLGNQLNVKGTVDVQSSAELIANDNLNLLSSLTGTARVDDLSDNGGGSITGNVTVERYIPGNPNRAWRLLGVPTTSSRTIRQEWMEGDANTTPNANNNPGYGTIISTGIASQIATGGFDAKSNSTSIRSYDGVRFNQMPSVNIPVNTDGGYFIYVRGDRSVAASNSSNTSPAILRTTGALKTGTQNAIPTTTSGYILVGNPYTSAIDFSKIISNAGTHGINNTLYLWDAKRGATGGYETFSGIDGYEAVAGGGSWSSGESNSIIQSGQAFFVYGTGAIQIEESNKTTGSDNKALRPLPVAKIKTRLLDADGKVYDGNAVIFNKAYSNEVDKNDAVKLNNPGENFSIATNNATLTLEARNELSSDDVLQFDMNNMRQQQYSIEFTSSHLPAGTAAYLEDNYLGTSTEIDLHATTKINFSVTADEKSAAANRFKLVFKKAAIAIDKEAISIAPNPVEGANFNISFTKKQNGRYNIRLTNVLGQQLLHKSITHAGGNSTYIFSLPAKITSGTYLLEVISPLKVKEVFKIIVNK